jgi:FkbM family methyltransferase
MRTDQLRSFKYLWGEAAGVGNKLQLGAYVAAGRLAYGSVRRWLPSICVSFRQFELEFRPGRGELTPYAQIQEDLRNGTIPRPPAGEKWLVVDCGANIGLFSLFLKDAGRIIAVEPNPDVHARLARNFHRNGVHGSTINKAVSASPGTVRMDFRASTVLASITSTGETEVEATTLDAIATQEGIEHIDLLKLDLEGHELEALRGASRMLKDRRIRRIYAEFSTQTALDGIEALLAPLGFQRTNVSDFNALYVLDRDAYQREIQSQP